MIIIQSPPTTSIFLHNILRTTYHSCPASFRLVLDVVTVVVGWLLFRQAVQRPPAGAMMLTLGSFSTKYVDRDDDDAFGTGSGSGNCGCGDAAALMCCKLALKTKNELNNTGI